MVTEIKKTAVEELRETFSGAKVAVFASMQGVTVEQVTNLRKNLRASDAKLKVVKNTLAKIAVEETSFKGAKPIFKGPVTVALGYGDDISAPAKTMLEFTKEKKGDIKILGAVLEGAMIDAAGVKALADMPPKPVVQAMLLGVLQAPARNLLGVLEGAGRKFLYALNAIADKKKETGQD